MNRIWGKSADGLAFLGLYGAYGNHGKSQAKA